MAGFVPDAQAMTPEHMAGDIPEAGFGEEMAARAGLAWMRSPAYSIYKRMEEGGEDVPAYSIDEQGRPPIYIEKMAIDEFKPSVLSKEQWEQSEWYRPGIEYEPEAMTETRARVRAEVYDARKAREDVLSRSPGGSFRGLAGFATEFATSALDPINYIPVFGQGARAWAAGSIGRRALLSFGEAAIATAAVEPLIINYEMDTGGQLAWEDAAWDIMLSGAVGGMFGTGAGLIAKRRGIAAQAHMKAVIDHLNSESVDVGPVIKPWGLDPKRARQEAVDAFFERTEDSRTISIDQLLPREQPNADKLTKAQRLMAAAAEGKGPKRQPLDVVDIGDGQYRVFDGNTTLHALKNAGAQAAEVRVYYKAPQLINDVNGLLKQAAKNKPAYHAMLDELAGDFGGIVIEPRVKGLTRANNKVADGIAPQDMQDYLAGTIVFRHLEDLSRLQEHMQQHPWLISKIDDKIANPQADGYRDVSFVLRLPDGHIAELQLNIDLFVEFKKAAGHKVFKTKRALPAVWLNKDLPADVRRDAKRVYDELNELSRNAYDAVWRDRNTADALVTFERAVEETLRALSKIRAYLSGSETGTLLPSEATCDISPSSSKKKTSFSQSKNDGSNKDITNTSTTIIAPSPEDINKSSWWPTEQLHADPDEFQYKSGMDSEGVGRELKSLKKYDHKKGGVMLVWRNPFNGRVFVVDGHHRLELAKRTKEPYVNVLFIDSPDAAGARLEGALTNVANGRGTAVDAAKLFRETGLTAELLESIHNVSMTGAMARNGMALAQLNDRLFNMVATGKLEEGRGIAIGRALPDHAQQDALLALVEKAERQGKRLTNAEVEELARFVAGAGQVMQTQDSLFGKEVLAHPLALEMAQIVSGVKTRLGKRKARFGHVSDKATADDLAQAGNQINHEVNAAIADEAAKQLEVVDVLAMKRGPVHDVLKQAAEELANGKKSKAQAISAAFGEIEKAIQEVEAGRMGGGPGPAGRPGRNGSDRAPELITAGRSNSAIDSGGPDVLLKADGSEPKTGEPILADVYRGYGRADRGEAYADGLGRPIMGSDARYWAISEADAARFGPHIDHGRVGLRNPFVLTNDSQLIQLGGPIPDAVEDMADYMTGIRRMIEADGHDGVIVNAPIYQDIDQSGQVAKGVNRLMGMSQVIEFAEKQKPGPRPGGRGGRGLDFGGEDGPKVGAAGDRAAEAGIESPEVAAVEDLFSQGQLRRLDFTDETGGVHVLDEQGEWEAANSAIADAADEGEAWRIAAECLIGAGA